MIILIRSIKLLTHHPNYLLVGKSNKLIMRSITNNKSQRTKVVLKIRKMRNRCKLYQKARLTKTKYIRDSWVCKYQMTSTRIRKIKIWIKITQTSRVTKTFVNYSWKTTANWRLNRPSITCVDGNQNWETRIQQLILE